MTVLVITGTGTGVGKTVVTAALAAHAVQLGFDVTVCKPVQTGTGAGDDDLAEVGRLVRAAGAVRLAALMRYPQPLAPRAAAERAGARLADRADLTRFVAGLDSSQHLTLVEGAGGLLVELGNGVTLRDLALDLRASVLVVTGAELGTLNYTALTLEALATRRLHCAGLVIGSWPAQPEVVHLSNRDELGLLAPLRAVLPAGAGASDAAGFARTSAQAFDRDWVAALVG